MAHIVIDARPIFWPGIGRYTAELLKNLEQLKTEHFFTVLMREQDAHLWHPSSPRFSVEFTDVNPQTISEQIYLPWQLYGLKADLVHFTVPTPPVLYGLRQITTIYDFTLVDFKNIRGNALLYQFKYWGFRLIMKNAIKRAAHILTITNFVRTQIPQRYKVDAAKISTTHCATDLPTIPKHHTKPIVKDDYLLYVGSYYPYKNIPALVEAFHLLLKKNPKLKLVLAGKADYFQQKIRNLVLDMGLEKSVIFPGYVSDDELVNLYQHAKLYVFPSLSEGFGLPGLEAMSFGTPVASSTATCLPEVYGDAAVYFNPNNPSDIASVIHATIHHPKTLGRLEKAGLKRIKEFSWKRMAEQTLEAYDQALK